jgi:predicted ATP-grasp superfamily ATP-dependent carboligase
MTRHSVLVLDGQTNEGLACVRSLGQAGYRVLVASHRHWPLGAWSRHARGSFRLAGETRAAFSGLRDWASGQGIGTVLPLSERSCVLCNLERDAWESRGIRVGCGPEELLQRAFDKAETLRYAAVCGVGIPPTRTPHSLEECHQAAEELRFPCIVKSRFSNAWQGGALVPNLGTSYVRGPKELERNVLAHRQGSFWPLIQGYVPGRGKGVFAVFNRGRAVAWFAHERLRDVRPSGSGSSLRRAIALPERLRSPAMRLLTALEWHGPAMVEFRDDEVTAPCLMEVNGRFWGSLQLAVDAGVDFPRIWLDVLRGQPAAAPGSYREDVVLRWLWGDIKRALYILKGRPAGYPGSFPGRWQGLRELLGPQPRGTRLETWRRDDPWPALGELVQGLGELVVRARGGGGSRPAAAMADPAPCPGSPAVLSTGHRGTTPPTR